jgi:hypothetical protein
MKPRFACTVAALAAALSLAAMPAGGQDRRGEGRERTRDRSAQSGGGGRERSVRQAVPRSSDDRQTSAAQASPRSAERRPSQPSQDRSSSNQARAYRNDDRHGFAQPGGGFGRNDYRSYVRPPHFQPYRPFYFARPYYGFRPHVHLGFGIWLGAPVPYPWAYFGAYVPRVYGYYDRGYYGMSLGVQQYGGLSFDIQPYDAGLFVDGEYVGTVGTFTPYGEPLTLWPGVHRVAIVRDGFRAMEFDVTIEPGRVIPYRGMLARW